MNSDDKISKAETLLNAFADRTGLNGQGNQRRRYLWTDALAVRAFIGLYHLRGKEEYKEMAFKLIKLVHQVLGQYRDDDKRTGWISGLSEKQAQEHPTAGGLRIGKDLPERKVGASYNAQMEWGRDGQYYHYLTKWMGTLFLAYRETGDQKYANWAAELAELSDRFIEKDKGKMRMYWKMSTDLSRPLVDSMGAQDPLEGAILSRRAMQLSPQYKGQLEAVSRDMDKMCKGKDWSTTDPLGLGGLLLNVPIVLKLEEKKLKEEFKVEKLLEDANQGLQIYKRQDPLRKPAFDRLPFRECGLSLGLRVIQGLPPEQNPGQTAIQSFYPLADEIEEFWCRENHQKVHTWTEHLDINSVTLASSLIANSYPKAFQ